MSLSKSKCWYSNNCLHFLRHAVRLLLEHLFCYNICYWSKCFCNICCYSNCRYDNFTRKTVRIVTTIVVGAIVVRIIVVGTKVVGTTVVKASAVMIILQRKLFFRTIVVITSDAKNSCSLQLFCFITIILIG